jgi:hypothetical protein
MMEEDLRSKVADDAAVKALVDKASIAWGDRPQASAFPGITFELIGGPLEQHMQGFQALQRVPVQASAWSRATRLEARDVREALVAALVPAGTVGDNCVPPLVRRSPALGTFERSDDSSIVYRAGRRLFGLVRSRGLTAASSALGQGQLQAQRWR